MSGPTSSDRNARYRRSALFLLLLAALPAVEGLAQEAAVIVNSGIDLHDIELDRLRRIYKGRQKNLTGGDRVYHLIVPLKDHPEREAVLRNLFEMDESLFFRYWKGENDARPPKELSVLDAIAEVGKSTRAIAIVGVGCPARRETAAVRAARGGSISGSCEAALFEVDGRPVAAAGARCETAAEAAVTLMRDDLVRLGAREDVKVLTIDGLEPCGKGYRLRLTTETRGRQR